MKLKFDVYKDKVYACWIGKNIGGTMGAPYEGTREVLDVKGFASKAGEPLPNDDLDLQLIWLHAMETTGPYNLDCKKLGEYWISFISPHWNEYGMGKMNMKHGLLPPLSGDYENTWKDSNGAWIRTEIFATLAPGCPDVAAKYSIEDACVDHGAGEGTIAAAFVAAMQSAAFVNRDVRACIDVALSMIPAESRMAKTVVKILECYDNGVSWLDCRNTVQQMNADIGNGWFEAPSNVGYAVLGLIYGEGDFKKSMITAINCGDDTDCTGATVGATLGILGGTAAIPTDWKDYIGDGIVTMSIAEGILRNIPTTCTQLTERVVNMAPTVLWANRADVTIVHGDEEAAAVPVPAATSSNYVPQNAILRRLEGLKPYQFEINAGLFTVRVTYDRAPDIAPGEELGVTVSFIHHVAYKMRNASAFGNIPFAMNLRWWTPDGFTVEGKRSLVLEHNTSHHRNPQKDLHFTIKAGEHVEAQNRLVLEVVTDGRPNACYVPLVLMG